MGNTIWPYVLSSVYTWGTEDITFIMCGWIRSLWVNLNKRIYSFCHFFIFGIFAITIRTVVISSIVCIVIISHPQNILSVNCFNHYQNKISHIRTDIIISFKFQWIVSFKECSSQYPRSSNRFSSFTIITYTYHNNILLFKKLRSTHR